MSTSKPFGRSLALMVAIAASRDAFGTNYLGFSHRVRELVDSKEFQSRGHGRSKRRGVNVKALSKMAKHQTYYSPPYVPFGGKREIARRAARFAV